MKTSLPTLAAMTAILCACAAPGPAPDTAWQGQAREVAASVPPKLLAVLTDEIAKGGPEGAIDACRQRAPAMALAASQQSGWNVRRVSLRQRNPKAVPDAWERATLEDFDRRAAAGQAIAGLERVDVVPGPDGKPEQRYMKALPVIELCTGCHGMPDRLSPAVVAKLKANYPDDRATGYRVGEIRGALTLRRAVP